MPRLIGEYSVFAAPVDFNGVVRIGRFQSLEKYLNNQKFNPREYGAVPDIDSTQGLQKAIDAAANTKDGGGIVEIDNWYYHTGLSLHNKVKLVGNGANACGLIYTPSSGIAIDCNNIDSPVIKDMTLTTNAVGSTATGIRVFGSDHGLIEDIIINLFGTNIKVTGSSADRSFNTRLKNVISIDAKSIAFTIDHAIDTHLTTCLGSVTQGNPLSGWSLIIDTGASGVYLQGLSLLFGGFKVVNSTPGTGAGDFHPQFIFGDTILSDTVSGTDCILFDSSLSTPDGLGRIGASYHFTNLWGAGGLTDGKVGIKIAGGQDISISDSRVRANRYHGIQISGGSDIRIVNPLIVGNNIQNSDGDGIRVDANVNDWSIIGGRIGNNFALDAGLQKYGVHVIAGTSTSYSIIGVNCSGNVTGPILDGGTGIKTIFEVMDFAGGGQVFDKLYSGNGRRLEFGDGNSFIDFGTIGAGQIYYSFDSNYYFSFDRSTHVLQFILNGVQRLILNNSGVQIGPSGTPITQTRYGQTTLVAGTKVVNDSTITANSKIFLTVHTPGGTPGWLQISNRVVGTSFTILSSNVADTSVVDYQIVEP